MSSPAPHFLRPGLAAGIFCCLGAMLGLESGLDAPESPGMLWALLSLASETVPFLGILAGMLLLTLLLARKKLRPLPQRVLLTLLLLAFGHQAGHFAAKDFGRALPIQSSRKAPPLLLAGEVLEGPHWRWLPPFAGEEESTRSLSLVLEVGWVGRLEKGEEALSLPSLTERGADPEGRQALSEAEVSRTEPSTTEPSTTELSKAGISTVEISMAEHSKTKSSEAVLSKTESSETENSESEIPKVALSKAELSEAALSEAERSKTELPTELTEAEISKTELSKLSNPAFPTDELPQQTRTSDALTSFGKKGETSGGEDTSTPARAARVLWEPARGRVLLAIRLSRDFEEDAAGSRRSKGGFEPPAPANSRPPALGFGRGDFIEVSAHLRGLSGPANPGEAERQRQFWRRGIFRVGSADLRSVVVVKPSDRAARRAEGFRRAFADEVARRVSAGDEAALVSALAVGEREDLGVDVQEHFRRSGLAHLLALSGLHLGLLVLAVLWLLRALFSLLSLAWWRVLVKPSSALLALPITLLYVILVGAPPSTIRAGIAAGLVLLAYISGRKANALNTWGWCLAALSLIDPPLLFAISTQLSFAGVLGVLLFSEPLQGLIPFPDDEMRARRSPALRLAKGALTVASASAAATLSTTPLSVLYFGQAPTYAVLSNLLAWPATLVLVPAGALAATLFAISPGLAALPLWVAGLAAKLLLGSARLVSALPLASVSLPTPGPGLWLLVGLAAIFLLRRRRWSRRQMSLLLGLILCAAALEWGRLPLQRLWRGHFGQELELTFLSVGQGDAAFIRFPKGSTMLVDAGGNLRSSFDPGERIVAPFLRHHGVRHLNTVVASHPHPDHIQGLFAVLEQFSVGELWHNGHRTGSGELQEPLLLAARQRGIALKTFHAPLPSQCPGLPPLEQSHPLVADFHLGDPRCPNGPMRQEIDGVAVEILHPLGNESGPAFPELGENDNSLVFRLVHGDIRVLFTGDLEAEGEALLLARGFDLGAELLKVPHHGSRSSSTTAFIRAVNPQHVVFCVGVDNRFAFPAPEVEARYLSHGCELHRSDLHGAIQFISDGKNLRVRRFLGRE